MFLSRVAFEPTSLAVVRDLGDVVDLHRTIMRAFPQHDGHDARAAFGVLFRTEEVDGERGLLVQSEVAPDWDRLPEGYSRYHEYRDASTVLDALRPGRLLRFRLVANPCRKSAAHRHAEAPPRNNRRVALVTDEDRHAWLMARGERGGFRLAGEGSFDGVRIDALPPVGRGGRGRAGIHVRPVRYEGAMEVIDAELLRNALRAGIGPAKAYGCGLLSVAALG